MKEQLVIQQLQIKQYVKNADLTVAHAMKMDVPNVKTTIKQMKIIIAYVI